MADRIEVKVGYPDADASFGDQGVAIALIDVVGVGNKWERLQGGVLVNNSGPLDTSGDDLLVRGPIDIRLKGFSLFQVPPVGATGGAVVAGDEETWQWRVDKID